MTKPKQRLAMMHHFIDEAGDLSLFNRRKQVVLGIEGVSNYFMVGAAFVADPEALNQKLASLRDDILRDLHLAESNTIVVARRGTRDRKDALTTAIGRAQENFAARWGARNFGPCDVATAYPHESGGLQATDYFLWALQRLYERRDDRYFAPLAKHYRIIMDLDDTRRKAYGEWYSDSNPLTLEKLKPVTG